MPKRVRLSESVIRFRENRDMLVYATFTLEQYKTLVTMTRKKAKVGRNVKKILDEISKAGDKELIYNLLFAQLVTILEVYLKDRVVEELRDDPEMIEKFLKGYRLPRKITVDDVLVGPEGFTASILDDMVFHNIKKVDALYKIVFGFNIIQFSHYKNLDAIVKFRHMVLHGGGVVDGRRIRVTSVPFNLACQEISNLVEGIDYYIRYGRKRRRFPDIIGKHFKEYKQLWEWDEYKMARWENIRWPDLTSPKEHEDNEIVI